MVAVSIVKESGSAVFVKAPSAGVDWLAEFEVVLNGLATANPRVSVVLESANGELIVSDHVCRIDSVRTLVRTAEDIEGDCFELSSKEA